MATTEPAGHSGFPQPTGPAVREREIGLATGSRAPWHARGLEIAACPARLKDSGGRHHRTPWRHLNVGFWMRALIDEALEEQQATDGLEAGKGKPGACSQSHISDPKHGQLTTLLDGP